MNKLSGILTHITVILALVFLVFLVLDQFNPMMNFVNNDISRWLLALLCASGTAQSILYWIGRRE
jgi:hypothetical protein